MSLAFYSACAHVIFLHVTKLTTHNLKDTQPKIKEVKIMDETLKGWPFEPLGGTAPDGGGDGSGPCPG